MSTLTRSATIQRAAREYTEALDQLHMVNTFDLENPGRISVGWDHGACSGYKELAAEIGKIVQERWHSLRDEARANASARVLAAEEALNQALSMERPTENALT